MSFIIHCRSGMAVELEVNGTGQGRWGCLGRSYQPLTLIASAVEETVSKTGAWLTERAHWSYCEPQLQSGWAEVRWWERLCSPTFVSIRSFVHSSTLPSFLPSLLSPLLSAFFPQVLSLSSHLSSRFLQAFFPSSSHPSLILPLVPPIAPFVPPPTPSPTLPLILPPNHLPSLPSSSSHPASSFLPVSFPSFHQSIHPGPWTEGLLDTSLQKRTQRPILTSGLVQMDTELPWWLGW